MSLTREEWLRGSRILGLIVLVCIGIIWAQSKVHYEPQHLSKTAPPSTLQTPPAPAEPAAPRPAYEDITPYETTADAAFALLREDCFLSEQTVVPDSKMPGSLELKKTYTCGRRKLQLYFNRTDSSGPYYVTFKSYVQ
jgi:hypothetical protein